MNSIPILMTIYRLVAAPVAAGMALAGYREAFFALIALSLLSDLLDGPIARWLKQESAVGAMLDTVADGGTVLAALVGIYLFEAESLRPELPWLLLFLATYVAAAGAGVLRHGALPAYHLYLSKAAAVGSAIFFLWLFLLGYERSLFLGVIGVAVLANLESLLVSFVLPRFHADVGSLPRALALARKDRADLDLGSSDL